MSLKLAWSMALSTTVKSLGTMRRPLTSTERWSSISRTRRRPSSMGRIEPLERRKNTPSTIRSRRCSSDCNPIGGAPGYCPRRAPPRRLRSHPCSDEREARIRSVRSSHRVAEPARCQASQGALTFVLHLREWRNGRRASFRCWCPKGRGGSSPPSRTRNPLQCKGFLRVWGPTSNGRLTLRGATGLDMGLFQQNQVAPDGSEPPQVTWLRFAA